MTHLNVAPNWAQNVTKANKAAIDVFLTLTLSSAKFPEATFPIFNVQTILYFLNSFE
jgi:hypothetical protein